MNTHKFFNAFMVVTMMAMAIGRPVSVSAQVDTAQCPEGMISYWRFEEGVGSTASDSFDGNDGIVNGATWIPGIVDGALDFGGSDYVEVLNSASLNPEQLTLELWASPSSTGYYRSLAEKQIPGFAYPWVQYALNFSGDTSRPSFNVTINNIVYGVIADDPIPLNAWTHVAGTYDGETLSLFVNGVLVKTETSPSGPIDSSPDSFYIGKPPSNAYYYGTLDEVALYSRALSAPEVEQHYQNSLNGGSYCEPAPRKVGLVTAEGGIADMSFNWLAYQGLQQAETDLGIIGSLYESASSDDYAPLLQQCADDGNDLCFAVGFSMADAIVSAANANPYTAFAILDVDLENSPANLRGIRFDEKQVGYLAGALAGKMSGSNIVGVVGGMEIPPVVGFVEGYRNGAQCANPNATVLIEYTGTFTDPDLGASTAQSMIDQGAHVIFGAAGGTGNGAILYSAGQGIKSIGVDTDQYLTLFGNGTVAGSYHLLTSAMKNLNVAVYRTVDEYLNGNFSSGTVTYHLADGGVGLAPYHEAYDYISQPIRDYVEYDVRGGILDGSIDINETCRDEPLPPTNFEVWTARDEVDGWWFPDTELTIQVDDPGTGLGVDYTATTWTDAGGNFDIWLEYDFAPGFTITVTDGLYTKEHIATSLAITNVDVDNDIVYGVTDPDSIVHAWFCFGENCNNSPGRTVTADSTGAWMANFSIPGPNPGEENPFDIPVGILADATQGDEDGDLSRANWQMPNPAFNAQPFADRVDSWDWIEGTVITLTIDDPATPQNPDYADTQNAQFFEWDPNQARARFELQGVFDLQSGHIVTLTDGNMTKIHTVTSLSITGVDPDTDAVFGTADPGTVVDVRIYEQNGPSLQTTADGSGFWSADFAGLWNIDPGMNGVAEQRDPDGDYTAVDWDVRVPVIWAHPNDSGEDWIDARDWNFGETIQLTIDNDTDPSNGTLYIDSGVVGPATWNPSVGVKEFHLGNFDLQPGHIVTLTGGTTTKDLVITDLDITDINAELDTISGTAVPGSAVQAWFHEEECNFETYTDEIGFWTVDFTPCDVRPAAVGGGIGQKDADEDSTVYFWRLPNPTIGVRANDDHIEGWEWPLGATITVTVDNPDTPVDPDITRFANVYEASWNPGEFRFDLDLREEIDVLPGFMVTATDGNISKQLIVSIFTITNVDLDTNTVSGIAEPNQRVNIWTCWQGNPCVSRDETADGDGNWSTNFSIPGEQDWEQETADLRAGSWIDSSVNDEDGDQTMFGWRAPNPTIGIRANDDKVEGWEWTLGSTITVTVDDPGTPDDPDITRTAEVYEAPWNPGEFRFDLDLKGVIDIQPGFEVTASDGSTTKVHTVTSLAFTEINIDTDTVTGTAVAGSQVDIWTCDNTNCYNSPSVFANGNGDWVADFTNIYDIVRGTWVDSSQRDDDGDQTMFGWSIPNPNFSVRLTENEVHGYTWPLGVQVTLSIDDPNTPQPVDYTKTQTSIVADWNPNETFVQFRLWEDGFTLGQGMTVTMSDGTTEKTHQVTELTVTAVDVEADTVSGTATPETQVDVGHIYCDENGCYGFRRVIADQDGNWIADFSAPGEDDDEQDIIDITPGMGNEARQCDDDGDCTQYGWYVFSYTLHAVPAHPEVHGHDWVPGSDITLTIDDDTDPNNGLLYTRTKNADDDPWCGYPCFDLNGAFDLQVGQYITMTDGDVAKTVHVSTLTITSVDMENETLSGIADPGSDVMVNIWSQEGKARHTVADANGNWSVDFSIFGDEDFEQFTTDISYGDNGRAIQLNPDGTDDGTLEYWNQDWVAPDTIPLVVAVANTPDLSRLEYTLESWTVYNLLWEPLFRTTAQGDLEPAAASDFTLSPDGLTYTITLRNDLLWSDGTPVTAQQYVDGFTRILSPGNAADYASLLFDITGAEEFNAGNAVAVSGLLALNDDTLQITLKRPVVYMLKILAIPGMMPARMDLIAQYGDAWFAPQNFIGNGPYTLAEYDGGHILFQKNQLFHNAANVAFEQIAFDVMDDANKQVDMYKNGDVDVVLDAPTETLTDPNFGSERVFSDLPGVYYVGLNLQRAPTDDVLVRKALAAAIDRRSILDNVLNMPWRQEATGVIPPELFGYQGANVGYTYNPLIAQNLLADAGYPGGAGLPTVHVYGFPGAQSVLEAIAEQWRTTLNISVETHYLDDFNSWIGGCENAPGDCPYNAFRAGWIIDYYDPHNILNDLFNPDNPFTKRMGWDSARYRELLELSRAETDPTQRLAYINEAEQILVHDDVAVIPIFFYDRGSLIKPGFQPVFAIVPYFDQWNSYEVFNPTIEVNPADDEVVGFDWRVDSNVTLTINDPTTPEPVDYTLTKTVHPLTYGYASVATFRLTGIFDIQPGYEITLDDGSTTRTIVVSDVQVDEVNEATDTITGSAAPGSYVGVDVCGPAGISGCASRLEIADGAGEWSADFSVLGDQEWEQDTLDLIPGVIGTATQYDDDGDTTIARLAIFTSPPAGFTPTESVIVPAGDSIRIASVVDLSLNPDDLGADALNAIQLAIEDFSSIQGFSVTETSFDSDCNSDFNTALNAATDVISNPQFVGVIGHPCSFSFDYGLPLYEAAGLVAVSGSSTQFYTPRFGPTVANRVTLNDYFYENVYWNQIVQEMPSVQVWNARYQMRFNDTPGEYAVLYYDAAMVLLKRIAETAELQPDGSLLIDRSELAAAVRGTQNYNGVSGSITLDVRGDRIESASNGEAHVGITEKLVWAPWWSMGEMLTLHVYDQQGNLIYNPPAEEVVQAFFSIDEWPMAIFYYGDDFVMQPGYRVVVSNGTFSTDVVVADLEVTEVNIATDKVAGTAAPGSDVIVNAWRDGIQRHVVADGNGVWLADFSVPGDESYEQDTLNIGENTALSIDQYNGSNRTYLSWPLAEVRGFVLLDGQPLAGVEVWLNGPKWDYENYNWYACTDQNGSFAIQKLPPGPNEGFISETGPSGALPCANAEFMDADGKPLLMQFWDHVNGIFMPTPFDLNFDTQPYHELQYNVARAQAYHPFLIQMHVVDLAGSGACLGGAGTCDIPLNDVPLKAYDRNNNDAWVAWWSSGWSPWPDGGGQLRYETLSDYTVEATYFDPDLNQDVILTAQLDATTFADRGDGVYLAPTLTINFIKIIYPNGSVEVYPDSDSDGDGQPDLLDACPGDPENECDASGSASSVITPDGGVLATEDGSVQINVPAGAVDNNLTLNVTDMGGGYEIATYQGTMSVFQSYRIEPNGTNFNLPVTITFQWNDADNNGIVDGTTLQESKIILIKDGLILTASCAVNPNCNMADNTLIVQVTDLSLFELAAPPNTVPQIEQITAPISPVQLGQTITATVTFSDPDASDTHTARWIWGDGTISTLPATPPTASAFHTYTATGVYTVTVTITDAAGESDSESFQYVVIYDPYGGFATGGGWFYDPDTGSKAHFGFNPKYHSNGTLKGETEFKLDGMKFKSTSHEWLVITGTKAILKGTGTINGIGEYNFVLTAIDGTPDKFQIKIWDAATGEVIYDNQPGSDSFADPTTAIQGGSIVIHKPK